MLAPIASRITQNDRKFISQVLQLPEKTTDISQHHHWFPNEMTSKMMSEKWHIEILMKCFWNFCACFSDIISQGIHQRAELQNVSCLIQLQTILTLKMTSVFNYPMTI